MGRAVFHVKALSRAPHHLDLGREGGHSANRIIHARDLTGKEVENSLLNRLKRLQNVVLYENH